MENKKFISYKEYIRIPSLFCNEYYLIFNRNRKWIEVSSFLATGLQGVDVKIDNNN